MDKIVKAGLIEKFRSADKRLVLLDYDGTLVNYTPLPDTAKLSEQLFDILIKLAGNLQTQLYIITGRGYQDIDKLLGHIPVDIIAEHGAMIKENGIWKNQLIKNILWKKSVIPILNRITHECPESFVEEKHYSLAWHYRNADPQTGYVYSRKLIGILEDIIHSCNLKILDGNKVVELMAAEVGKGKAVRKLCEENTYDFILSVGDDATDEEMFEFFLNYTNAFTIKVGNGDTFAKYKLSGINDVVSLLKHLSE